MSHTARRVKAFMATTTRSLSTIARHAGKSVTPCQHGVVTTRTQLFKTSLVLVARSSPFGRTPPLNLPTQSSTKVGVTTSQHQASVKQTLLLNCKFKTSCKARARCSSTRAFRLAFGATMRHIIASAQTRQSMETNSRLTASGSLLKENSWKSSFLSALLCTS